MESWKIFASCGQRGNVAQERYAGFDGFAGFPWEPRFYANR